jgi:hypothetical protein
MLVKQLRSRTMNSLPRIVGKRSNIQPYTSQVFLPLSQGRSTQANQNLGLPPKLAPPNLPVQLQRDKLKRSKPRSPAAAVDPLFESLLHQHPNFDMSPIQLVTDRNSLRKLLNFASDRFETWRIDVDMINDIMFFNQ